MKKVLLPVLVLLVAFACSKDEPAVPALDVSPKIIEKDAAEVVVDVHVTSNVDWSAATPASDWISISPASGSGNGTIKVTLAANESLNPRTGKITVKGEGKEEVIEVEQEGASKEAFFIDSKWEMVSQNSGEEGYDDLVGTILELNSDKSAVAILDIDMDGVQITSVEGTWNFDGDKLKIEAMLGELPLDLIFDITEVTDTGMTCQMGVNVQLLPQEGIEVVFKKI